MSRSKFGDCNGCTIQASPTIIRQSPGSIGEWVTVNVVGVGFGGKNDWIGVFAPEDISAEGVMLRYPVRYQLASKTCEARKNLALEQPKSTVDCVGETCCSDNAYTVTGNATVRFRLLNLRWPEYIFVLVQGPTQYPTVVARSNSVSFDNPSAPSGIHLALPVGQQHATSAMQVTWTSTSWPGVTQQVQWGLAPTRFDAGTAPASADTYNASQMCGVAAGLGFRDPGVQFTATMTNLVPGKQYWYSVGSAPSGWSHERHNYSFIAPGGTPNSVNVVVFGDMGRSPAAWDGTLAHSWDNFNHGEVGSWNVTQQLKHLVPSAAMATQGVSADAVVHFGDISYAVGFAAEWDEFAAQIEEVAAQVPWMTSPGNHESNCQCFVPPESAVAAGIGWLNGSSSNGECGVPLQHRYPLGDDPWYSVAVGPISFVVMSTEHDFSTGSAQLRALDTMLANVDRKLTPWVVFTGHRPMYVDSKYPSPSAAPLQRYVEPLLLTHGVDLALWGHHHSYHRSCRMTKGICSAPGQSGLHHLVIGTAGYEFSPVATGASAPGWVQFANDTQYGYANIVANHTHLDLNFIRADNAQVMDQLQLQKQ